MVLSLHKQPFVTAHFQFITAHFLRHCALKNALPLSYRIVTYREKTNWKRNISIQNTLVVESSPPCAGSRSVQNCPPKPSGQRHRLQLLGSW